LVPGLDFYGKEFFLLNFFQFSDCGNFGRVPHLATIFEVASYKCKVYNFQGSKVMKDLTNSE
jgi:hypothetical protein